MTVTGDLLLWNGRLLDGRGGPPRDHVAMDVRAGLIAGVEDIVGATAPDGARDIAGRRNEPLQSLESDRCALNCGKVALSLL